jgi:hypothetical protein
MNDGCRTVIEKMGIAIWPLQQRHQYFDRDVADGDFYKEATMNTPSLIMKFHS